MPRIMIAPSHLLRLKPRWNHAPPRSDSNPIGQGSNPNRTLNIHMPTFLAGKRFSALREFAGRIQHANTLVTTLNDGSSSVEWLSLFRKRSDDQFPED